MQARFPREDTLSDLFVVAEAPIATQPQPELEPREVVPSPYFDLGHGLLNGLLLALVLPFALPLIPLIAAANAACLRSWRRVFFLQERIGKHGKAFRIFKFRTMALVSLPGSEAHSVLRVTRFGRFLRNTHLDELPQLLNILRGEMTFIGPRPEMVEIESWARREVPGFETQHAVKPGLSGLAQITQGYVGQDPEGYAEKLRQNLLYIRRASLRLDLSIVLRTGWWMLRRRGWRYRPLMPRRADAFEQGVTIRAWAQGFVERLGDRALPFAILRGAEILERDAGASDLDMLAPAAELARLEEHLEASCHEYGVTIFERHHAGALHQYYLHARTPEGRHEFFAVDVHTAECCFGVPYLRTRELLATTRRDGPARLGEAAAAVVNFLTPFMSGALVHARYSADLREALAHHRDEVQGLLRGVFGAERAERIVGRVQSAQLEALQREAPALRRAFLRRAFLRQPLRTAAALAACIWCNRVRPLWRPRGRLLAFLGTDGAGKSTLIEAVREELEQAFRSDRSGLFHMRPGLLPQINTVVHLGKTTYSLADMARPHRARPSGRLGSNLRLLYYWTDYVLGYATRVLPRRRRHSLIVFDRYFFDYRVDPLRSRIQLGNPLARRLARWVPQPDHVIVCTAAPEVILERKDELPAPEVRRQVGAYEELAREEGYHLVHTGGSLRDGVDEVLSAMFPRES